MPWSSVQEQHFFHVVPRLLLLLIKFSCLLQIYENAMIAAGLNDDPRPMVSRLNELLTKVLEKHWTQLNTKIKIRCGPSSSSSKTTLINSCNICLFVGTVVWNVEFSAALRDILQGFPMWHFMGWLQLYLPNCDISHLSPDSNIVWILGLAFPSNWHQESKRVQGIWPHAPNLCIPVSLAYSANFSAK